MEINKIQQEIYQIGKSIIENLKLEDVVLTPSKVKEHGDFSTNLALRFAKSLNLSPIELANKIVERLNSDEIEKLEVVKPGFINIFIKKDNILDIVEQVNIERENYAQLELGKREKLLLEYVSANPTGALHLGHARGAAVGDSLSRILKKAGYDVTREYYVNDAGNQVNNLALSLKARYLQQFGIDAKLPENGYYGEDIVSFAKTLVEKYGDSHIHDEDFSFFRKEGIQLALDNIKKDLKEFRVEFDVFTSEQAIRDANKVEKVLELLKPYCYQKEGATYLNTTKDGDDKDRVLVKSDKTLTYLTPDISYHKDKFDRGFDKLIDILGADHHGYIARLKASLKILGYDPNNLEVLIIQIVRLMENGEEVKMSKRTGNAITIRELCEDVGVDVARYFFISKPIDSHLDFDLSLARKQSADNPVYYIQYAYARIASILEKDSDFEVKDKYSLLTNEKEVEILKHLDSFPKLIEDVALSKEVNKICNYVYKLAQLFHSYYNEVRIIDENKELTKERLALVKAISIVIKNALNLVGVDIKEKM